MSNSLYSQVDSIISAAARVEGPVIMAIAARRLKYRHLVALSEAYQEAAGGLQRLVGERKNDRNNSSGKGRGDGTKDQTR